MDREFLQEVKQHGAFQPPVRQKITAKDDPEAFRPALDEMFRVDLPVLDVDDIRGRLVDIVRPYLELFGPARQGRCHPLDLGDGVQRYSTDENSPDWVESAIEAIRVVDRIVAESRGEADLQIAARAFDLGRLVLKIDIQCNTDDVTRYGAGRQLDLETARQSRPKADVSAAEDQIAQIKKDGGDNRSVTALRKTKAEELGISYRQYLRVVSTQHSPDK